MFNKYNLIYMKYYVLLRNSPSLLTSPKKVEEHNFFYPSQDIFSEPRFRTYYFICFISRQWRSKTRWIIRFESRTVKSKFTRRHDDWSCAPDTFSLTLVRQPIRKRINRQQYITRIFEIFSPLIFQCGNINLLKKFWRWIYGRQVLKSPQNSLF